MPLRPPAGFIRPGFDPLKNPNAPTIGTATAGSTQISVAFTAPTNIGGSAITSNLATAKRTLDGLIVNASGAASPLVVTDLVNGDAYTASVVAINSYGPSVSSLASNSVIPIPVQGQEAYTTAGTYSWVCPAGVTSVSVVCVGGGGGGGQVNGGENRRGGGGGGLGYTNNISVVPGTTYTVVVGAGGVGRTAGNNGGTSYFISAGVCSATGGRGDAQGASGLDSTVNAGGTFTAQGGGIGGIGSIGGGGAAGYTGDGGGIIQVGDQNTGAAGQGGGGGSGGRNASLIGGGGGGVGLLGQGSNGAGGTNAPGGGGGGSLGTTGGSWSAIDAPSGQGGIYGGGSGAFNSNISTPSNGGLGAVRIIWPGTTRQFPSTNTGNV